MISSGETFTGAPLDRRGHLWIAISGPDRTGHHAMVNITTHRPGERNHSETCLVFRVGDHPFIRHDSCVAFRHSKLVDPQTLLDGEQSGEVQRHEPFTAEQVRRIQDGLLTAAQVEGPVRVAIRRTLRES